MFASPTKRQRLAGSFSPASPPYHEAKAADQTATTFQPFTPTSPPYMSTIQNANGDPSAAANHQRSNSSSTSPATMSQFSQAPATNTFPTPASSISGTVLFSQGKDGDGDVTMSDDSSGSAQHLARLGNDAAHRRTNHDRQGKEATDHYPFICHKPIPPSQPWHVSVNTLHEYGLDALARSVLRNDPVTGEKINKLRKTYKAVLQDLKLPGRPEPVIQKDQFVDMYRMPDDWWQAEVVGEFDLSRGFEGLPNLDRALKMDNVKLPAETEREARKVIGADDSKKKLKVTGEGPVKKPATPAAAGSATPAAVGNGQPSNPSAIRASRTSAKRRYNDASFKGYGEGYADDDLADSTAGEEDSRGGPSKKKRRKENYSGAGGMLGPPTNYSNVGMVGVRR